MERPLRDRECAVGAAPEAAMSTLLLLLALVQVDEPYQRFAAAYATLDADRVAQIYAEDALMLPPSGEILKGRAAIRERYARGFDGDRERGHTRASPSRDRKSTRLNSSHITISYAVFCL